MPLTHRRDFRVRHYECDIYQVVKDASYLRYMQEAAFDASAAAGYDQARYREIGRLWLIRETAIRFAAAARFGDILSVTTWVEDFRRVRSRRAYRLQNARTGELIADAFTDWVFLDLDSQRPAAIPPEMILAFYPEGVPEEAPPRERFPDAPPLPSGVLVEERRVEWRDLDGAGHVNNAVYAAIVEDSWRHAVAAAGWPPERLAATGLDLATHSLRIEYRLPALFGDRLETSTWFSAVAPGVFARHSIIRRAGSGDLLVQAFATWGCVDLQSRVRVTCPDGLPADLASITSA